MMKIIILIICILSMRISFAQNGLNSELIGKIEKLYSPISQANKPGGTLLISQNGKVVYKKAFGKANLELNVDMKIDNVFRLASNTKPFTVIAILKLVEQEKLSLQDNITKHIPNYPNGNRITIENLLTHTSGIKDFNAIDNFRKNERTDFSPAEFIELFKNQPLDFDPGSKWQYSNSGYFLLGYIIEKASGMSYSNYLNTAIFIPLKMGKTSYDSYRKIIKNRVDGYVPSEKVFLNSKFITTSYPYSAGSLLSSVEDLHILYNALFEYKIIDKNLLIQALTPKTLSNGSKTPTGYAWFLGNLVDTPIIEHSGGIAGFYSSIVYLPEEKIFIAALTNCNWSNFDFENSTKKIASIIIGKEYYNHLLLPIKQLESYVGIYRNNISEKNIIIEGNKIYSQRSNGSKWMLYNFAKDKFYNEIDFTTIQFIKNKNEETIQMITSRHNDETLSKIIKTMNRNNIREDL